MIPERVDAAEQLRQLIIREGGADWARLLDHFDRQVARLAEAERFIRSIADDKALGYASINARAFLAPATAGEAGDERQFPLLGVTPIQRRLGCPESISWALLTPHEAQARENHGQTLGRLAERGGLGVCEAAAVLGDRRWRRMTDEEAVADLLASLPSPGKEGR